MTVVLAAALGGGSAVMPEEQLAERELIRTGTTDSASAEATDKPAAAAAPGPTDAADGRPPRSGGDIAMTQRAPSSAGGRPAAAAPVPAETDDPAPPPPPAPAPDVPEDDEFQVGRLACHASCDTSPALWPSKSLL